MPDTDDRGDDPPALAGADHRHNAGMNDVIKTVEIGVDHAVPVIVAERRKSTVAGNTGVTDHAIPRAVVSDLLFQHRAALLAVAHVEGE